MVKYLNYFHELARFIKFINFGFHFIIDFYSILFTGKLYLVIFDNFYYFKHYIKNNYLQIYKIDFLLFLIFSMTMMFFIFFFHSYIYHFVH